jgi:hypothetical protein
MLTASLACVASLQSSKAVLPTPASPRSTSAELSPAARSFEQPVERTALLTPAAQDRRNAPASHSGADDRRAIPAVHPRTEISRGQERGHLTAALKVVALVDLA